MPLRRTVLAVVPLVVLAIMVHAQVWAAEADCAKPEGQATIAGCASKEFKAADAELNRVYRQFMNKIPAEVDKARLRKAEKAWIAYRDKECELEAPESEGGFVMSLRHTECFTRLTNARIDQLKQQFTCVEGDVTCCDESRFTCVE